MRLTKRVVNEPSCGRLELLAEALTANPESAVHLLVMFELSAWLLIVPPTPDKAPVRSIASLRRLSLLSNHDIVKHNHDDVTNSGDSSVGRAPD